MNRLLTSAREQPEVAGQCVWTLLHPDKDDARDWLHGLVGAVLVLEKLDAIKKGLTG